MKRGECRICRSPLNESFIDFGKTPLANALLEDTTPSQSESYYPLELASCPHCHLVQVVEDVNPAEMFDRYLYRPSYSSTWLNHLKDYAETVCKRLRLGKNSTVVEIASNDGALLGFFRERGVAVLGIEAAKNLTEIANQKGLPTLQGFFGTALAKEIMREREFGADLIVANNVLGHVPDPVDFVCGIKMILRNGGTATLEFPHLLRLLQELQFDTIYHEHFSYFSLTSAVGLFERAGLKIYDVEELATHGGSLRIHACHEEDTAPCVSARTQGMLSRELGEGLAGRAIFEDFSKKVAVQQSLLQDFLSECKKRGRSVAGYGAAAKATMLLWHCRANSDQVGFVVDRNPSKQGKKIPGSRIPISAPARILADRPDFLLIFPWNIRAEIVEQTAFIRQWGAKFLVPIPQLEVLP